MSLTDYTITYNGVTAKSKGLEISYRPSIPASVERVMEYTIPNRDGKLHRRDGLVEDIEIPVTFSFLATETTHATTFREIMAWLNADTDRRLIFSDDPEWFYKVKMVTVGADVERVLKVAGAFKATFLCEGYVYKISGQSATSTYTNNYDTSHPLYTIYGTGTCALTVNSKSMSAVVNGSLTIDTDLMLAYKTAPTLTNTAVTGDYDDLWLKPGRNTVRVTSGFTLTTIPRWRRRA